MRDEWVRRIRDAADDEIAARLRYDGKPLTELELAAVRVICGRLSWASVHWGDVHPDAIVALGVAFVRAGWRGPQDRALEIADAITEATSGRVIPSRSTDPDTSRKAEPAPIRAGTQRTRLLAAFALEAAADGLTDEEAADLADGVPYRSEFAKRCSELRAAGLIEVQDVTRKGVAGHERIVSAITDAGRAALERVGT